MLDRVAAGRPRATVSVEVLTPSISAPISTSISHRSMISGSRATLSMTVVPLGQHRGHHEVLGGPHAREVQPQVAAAEAVGHLGDHEAVLDADLAHRAPGAR